MNFSAKGVALPAIGGAAIAALLIQDAGNSMAGTGFDVRFARVIAESKAEAAEKTGISARQSADGVWETFARTWIEPKRIRVEIDSEEIARTEASKHMQMPDVEPIAAIQGDAVAITFPWNPPDDCSVWLGPDFRAEVKIDLKTKAVLHVLGGS